MNKTLGLTVPQFYALSDVIVSHWAPPFKGTIISKQQFCRVRLQLIGSVALFDSRITIINKNSIKQHRIILYKCKNSNCTFHLKFNCGPPFVIPLEFLLNHVVLIVNACLLLVLYAYDFTYLHSMYKLNHIQNCIQTFNHPLVSIKSYIMKRSQIIVKKYLNLNYI